MKIFCIGSANYDITVLLSNYPKEDQKTVTFKKIESGSGNASNVACMLSDWHEKVYIFGTVGADYYGEKIKNSFFLHNVNTKYLTVKNKAHTTTNHIIINEKNSSATTTTFKDKNLYAKIPKFLIPKPDVMYFDGAEYNLSLNLIKKYSTTLKILSASNYNQEITTLIPFMNYVIVNEEFIKEYLTIKQEKYTKINQKNAIKSLEEEYKTTFILALEEATIAKINEEYKFIPKVKAIPVDKTSINDIYNATFIYFITHNYSLEETINLASIAKAISSTRYGARFKIPTKQEVTEHDKNR